MQLKFTKMHGLGNDYIYVNCLENDLSKFDLSALSRKLSDRHFGIGSDGLVLILKSDIADFRMRMLNSDGSEAQMCGNAIRCVAKFVYDNGLASKKEITIETLAGIKTLYLTTENNQVELVKVDMGQPILECEKIPVESQEKTYINQQTLVGGQFYFCTCVSMGNPHCILKYDDLKTLEIEKLGPLFENNSIFPQRINTEFIEVADDENVYMRVWERGAGETLACGTGACAVAVACVLNGYTKRKVNVHLLGGTLKIEWDEKTNSVFMTGPATKVFDGTVEI